MFICSVSRFLDQFVKLQNFYNKCRNLQYFKYLVQVPSLPDNPPNFLVASELSQHVTPVAVVPDVVDDLVDDAASEISTTNTVPLHDERERYIDQLLAEIESLQVYQEFYYFPSLFFSCCPKISSNSLVLLSIVFYCCGSVHCIDSLNPKLVVI